MAERTLSKPEIASQKRVLKLPPALGDWTTYRPPQLPVKKVKSGLYGFDRLSRSELDLALKIHYAFTQELLRHFRLDLGLGVEFSSCQIEQTTYLNFLRQLAGRLVQARLNLAELHDNIQFYCDLDLASSLINHALGSHDLETLTRGLTEAENKVFTAALTEYLPAYARAFDGAVAAPEFTLIGSPDATLDPSISATATFVAFSAEIALNDNPAGKISFGYPGNSLKALLKLYRAKADLRPLDFSRLSLAVLSKITVPVKTVLGKTYLSTSEISQLETGDVVALDLAINKPVTLQISRDVQLPGQPGLRGRKKVVRLAGLETGEEVRIAPPVAVEAKTETPLPAPAAPAPAVAPPPPAEPAPAPVEETLSDEDFNLDDFDLDDLNLDEGEK
jgi:flagellar motor switch protein FliM